MADAEKTHKLLGTVKFQRINYTGRGKQAGSKDICHLLDCAVAEARLAVSCGDFAVTV